MSQQITAPKLPGRHLLHDLGGHQCILEIDRLNGQTRKTQVTLVTARNYMDMVLLRAFPVGGPRSEVKDYVLHHIVAIHSPDGTRHDARSYLRQQFGLVIA